MKKKYFRIFIFLLGILLVLAAFVVYSISVSRAEKKAHPIEHSELIERYGAENEVPVELIYAVIKTESGFREDAVSSAGAVGLMQIMPDTFDWLSRIMGEEEPPDNFHDPESNIRYGVYYLGYLYRRFGSWDTALAGYNAGHNGVSRWLEDPLYSDDGINLKHIPINETRNYIQKVNTAKAVYSRLLEDSP